MTRPDERVQGQIGAVGIRAIQSPRSRSSGSPSGPGDSHPFQAHRLGSNPQMSRFLKLHVRIGQK